MADAPIPTFEQAEARLSIGSLDKPKLTVKAQYNPKDLQIEQQVGWKKPEAANKTGKQGGKAAGTDPLELEFTGAEARTMTIELLFDGVEKTGRTLVVKEEVNKLIEMATVIEDSSNKEALRRPHQVIVTWNDDIPSFQCVIENLTTKYTMFAKDGTPLRATCTVKLKEAKAKVKKK